MVGLCRLGGRVHRPETLLAGVDHRVIDSGYARMLLDCDIGWMTDRRQSHGENHRLQMRRELAVVEGGLPKLSASGRVRFSIG